MTIGEQGRRRTAAWRTFGELWRMENGSLKRLVVIFVGASEGCDPGVGSGPLTSGVGAASE